MVIQNNSVIDTPTTTKTRKTALSDSLAGIAADYVEDCDTYEEQAVAKMLSSEAMRERAEANEAQEQITYLQTYDAALEETQRNLERAETFAERAASGDYSAEELAAMNEEYQQICAEIDGDSPLVYSVNAVTSVNRSTSAGASSTATGLWDWNGGSISNKVDFDKNLVDCMGDNRCGIPVPTNVDSFGNQINTQYDLSKWTESYVNSSAATSEERQKYLNWLEAMDNLKATVIIDSDYNRDTDPFKFVWSVNNRTYECNVDSEGIPTETYSLPLISEEQVMNGFGPQVYLDNFRFLLSDEDCKDRLELISKVTDHHFIDLYTSANGEAVGTYFSMDTDRYKELWVNNGCVAISLTYRGSGIWEDNFGGSGDKDYYGFHYGHGNEAFGDKKSLDYLINKYGDIPVGLTFNFSLRTPVDVRFELYGYIWNNSAVHTGTGRDYKMGEYDPANPSVGGIDPDVAIDGEVYKYDVTKQVNGVNGAWTNSAGEVVKLVDEGVHLPYSAWAVSPLHHGTTITISNPSNSQTSPTGGGSSASGSASGNNGKSGKTGNDFPLVIQAGARTKDAIGFSFRYFMKDGDERVKNATSSSGLGINTLSLRTADSAQNAVAGLQRAQSEVSSVRSDLAAAERQINSLVDAHSTRTMNAEEAVTLSDELNEKITHNNAQAMLAQANSLPQNVLEIIE